MVDGIILVGTAAQRAGSGFLFAAMCGLLPDETGVPPEQIHLLSLLREADDPAGRCLETLHREYAAVRGIMPVESDAFYTTLLLERAMIPEKLPAEDPEAELLLSGEEEDACQVRYRAQTRMWLKGPAASELMGKYATAAELLIVSSVYDGMGEAAFSGLPELLRRLNPDLRLHGLALCPDRETGEGWADAVQRTLGTEGLLRKEGKGRYDTLAVLGMPRSAFLTAGDSSRASLTDLLAVRHLMRLMAGTLPEGFTVYTSPADAFTWSSLGEEGVLLRRGLGRMLKTALLTESTLEGFVKEKLAASWHLKDLRASALVGLFKSLSDDDRYRSSREMNALSRLLQAYRIWMNQVLESLPAHFRDAAGQRQTRQKAAENYRQLLEMAGHLGLMRDEIARTGMAEETVISRGDTAETPEEELIRKAEEKEKELQEKVNLQSELDRKTGGISKFSLLEKMETGIASAMEQEREKIAGMDRVIATLEPGSRQNEAKEQQYRLEVHVRLLEKEMERVLLDRRQDSESGLLAVPPEISPAENGSNDLFDSSLLRLAGELQGVPETDFRLRGKLAQQLEEGIAALVLPSGEDQITLKALMNRMGQRVGEYSDGSPVGKFMAAAIRESLEDAALEQGENQAGLFLYLPDEKSGLPELPGSPEKLAESLAGAGGAHSCEPVQTARCSRQLKSAENTDDWRGLVAAALLCDTWTGDVPTVTAERLEGEWARAAGCPGTWVVSMSRDEATVKIGFADRNLLTPLCTPEELRELLPDRVTWYDRAAGHFLPMENRLNACDRELLKKRLHALEKTEKIDKELLLPWLEELDGESETSAEQSCAMILAASGFSGERRDFPYSEKRLGYLMPSPSPLLAAFGAEDPARGMPAVTIASWREVP